MMQRASNNLSAPHVYAMELGEILLCRLPIRLPQAEVEVARAHLCDAA